MSGRGSRLPVRKTYKLYVGGAFPRSESGRTYEAEGQNVARASRKDVRDAVRAARAAVPAWSGLTAYNRGQVLYRLAEMMEARASDLERVSSGRDEVEAAIDRVIWYAGWADKLAQVLGGSNPVAGPVLRLHGPRADRGRRDPRACRARTRRARLAHRPRRSSAATPSSPSPPRPTHWRRSSLRRRSPPRTSPRAPSTSSRASGRARPVARRAHGRERDRPHGRRRAAARSSRSSPRRMSSASSAPRADAQSPWEIEAFLELKTVWHPIGL